MKNGILDHWTLKKLVKDYLDYVTRYEQSQASRSPEGCSFAYDRMEECARLIQNFLQVHMPLNGVDIGALLIRLQKQNDEIVELMAKAAEQQETIGRLSMAHDRLGEGQ